MIQVKDEEHKITFVILCLLFFFVKKDIFDRL
jgi:hypothetical protein